jgi:hypothetical protein
MAQGGVRYLEQLLKQASRETNPEKLDKLTAEIYRVVAAREETRKSKPQSRGR